MDPMLTASALASMLEHFAYVWLATDGDAIDVEVDDETAIETLWMIWSRAIYSTEPRPVRSDRRNATTSRAKTVDTATNE
jgi:hypothetical protein